MHRIVMMDHTSGKHTSSSVRNFFLRLLLLCLLAVAARFAYVVAVRGESCDLGDFCFFSVPDNPSLVTSVGSSSSATLATSAARSSPAKPNPTAVHFYINVFQDLIVDGALSTKSKALCLDTPTGDDVFALREIGVDDALGIHRKARRPPLVVSGSAVKQPFTDDSFDFIFYGGGEVDRAGNVSGIAQEIARTLRPQGYLVVHTSRKDTYSFNSFVDLFVCCKFVKSRDIDGFDPAFPMLREIVMRKESGDLIRKFSGDSVGSKCSVPEYKRELTRKAEPIIVEEPLKPWITLKRNIHNVKYLPSMADISFKRRYVYVDVGARSYGSSIASWFKKQYPKQNKTFEIYAIEADRHFHEQYKSKKGVTLLPYAAWVKNESLFFEINQDPGDKDKEVEKGRGMGRIQSVTSSGGIVGAVDEIQGFDFADWLRNTVSEKDFVVMKMDVEGTEFELIPRLFETGAICLIDEIFLECHYNRWQKCCPGVRSPKYQKTYGQCLELFTLLRQKGVLVHQWW